MRVKRIDQMEKYILNRRNVSIEDLCSEFNISKNTARRDIQILVQNGSIKKIYGGVSALKTLDSYNPMVSYQERFISSSSEKEIVAKLACRHINSGDTIFLDSGTTILNIFKYIDPNLSITIITNNVLLLTHTLNFTNFNVIVLPGNLRHDTASTVGPSCIDYLKAFHIQKAFLSCTTISNLGISNSSIDEQIIKQTALKQSNIHYLLVDHSKFGKNALIQFATPDNFNYIITDEKPSSEYENYYKKHGIKFECP